MAEKDLIIYYLQNINEVNGQWIKKLIFNYIYRCNVYIIRQNAIGHESCF